MDILTETLEPHRPTDAEHDQDKGNQQPTGTAHSPTTTTPGKPAPSSSPSPHGTIPRKAKKITLPNKRRKADRSVTNSDRDDLDNFDMAWDDEEGIGNHNHPEGDMDVDHQEPQPTRTKKGALPKGKNADEEDPATSYTKWVTLSGELPHPPNNVTPEQYVKTHAAKVFANHTLHPNSNFAYLQDGKTGFALISMPIGHKSDWIDELSTLMCSPANADTNNTTKFQLQRDPWMAEDLKPIELTGTFPKPKNLPDAVPGEGTLKRRHRLSNFATQTGK